MASAAVDKRIESYRRLHIYGTKSRLYVVGHDEQLGICRILKFRRQDGPRLDVVEDPLVYTPDQCNLVLRKVHEQSGGLQLVCKGHGIIGCFRFTDSYYLLVVARREFVGHICGHKVYRIAETCLISLGGTQQRLDMAAGDSTAEKRYRKLLLGVDLTKNFFFAYSYSLAHTLQHNHKQAAAAAAAAASTESSQSSAAAATGPASNGSSKNGSTNPKPAAAADATAAASGWDVYDSSMFVWNAYLTRPLRVAIQSTRWTLPLIHGYWEQRQVSVFGRQLTLTLLARRSRHFAGTRFRKRGLSAQGFVANEVETEQIVDAGIDWATGQPLWSAMVQVRGSVPLFWSQQATPLSPKPDILLQQFDPIYEKTAAHFADLKRRYGDPIIALNLLKSKERRPREVLLRREYAAAVSLLNAAATPDQQILYIPWDFQKHAKQPGANILLEINSIMELSLNTSGIYVHGPASCDSCQPAIQQRFKGRAAAPAAAAAARHASDKQQQQQEEQLVEDKQALAAAQAEQPNPDQHQQQQQQMLEHYTKTAAQAVHDSQQQQQQQQRRRVGFLPSVAPKRRQFAPQTQLQRGVLRTNCIDCLDRTNVVQFAYGLAAFGRQLSALGVLDSSGVDSDSSIAFQLMEMYEGMGHTIALQYGGSEAHAAFFQKKRGEWEATTQSRDLMTSIRRFYSNAYTDAEKQDAINLFLGNYVPVPNAPPLWELDSDYYLHTDSAIRYSQLVASDRLPPAAVAATAALKAAAPAAADATVSQVVTAGGRNAPVILRQLSATTLPPSAFGFGSNVSSAAAAAAAATAAGSSGGGAAATGVGSSGGGSNKPQAAWISPFAAAGAAASAAAKGAAAGSSSTGGSSVVSTPLLPLTFSDGISIDACDTESSPSSAEGAFNFKLVFQQMLSTPEQISVHLLPQDYKSNLISLDNVLAKLPRTRTVRLYPTVNTRNNVMWEAVQQAFAFFSTEQALDAAAAAAASAGSSSFIGAASVGSLNSAAAAAGSSDKAESSIQSLDLTAAAARRQLQQQQSSLNAAAAAATITTNNSNSTVTSAAAVVASQPAVDSPSAAAAAAAAAASGQIMNAISSVSAGLRSPPQPAVSNLNDILEIRTDVTPVRLISSADKMPQAIGPHGPVIPARRNLDATLDELMWSQFGINISPSTQYNMSQNPDNSYNRSAKPQQLDRFSILTNPHVQGSRGVSDLRSGFGRASDLGYSGPGSPLEGSNQGLADRVWGGITTLGGITSNVVRGKSSTAAAAGAAAAGQKGLSMLNDILQVERAPTPAAAAASRSATPVGRLSGGSSKVAAATAIRPSNVSPASSPDNALAVSSPAAAAAADESGLSGSSSSTVCDKPSAQRTAAGRVSFLPAGVQGYPFASSSSNQLEVSGSFTAAAAGSSAVPATAAAAPSTGSALPASMGVMPLSPPASPTPAAAAAATGVAAATTSGRSSSTDPEWMVVDGHAVFIAKDSEQQQQQRGTAAGSDTAAAIAAVSAAAAYWSTPFRRSKKQQQQLQQDSIPDPDILNAVAATAGLSYCQPSLQPPAAAAAAAAEQQQQRSDLMYSMCAPVDAAAAAFVLCPSVRPTRDNIGFPELQPPQFEFVGSCSSSDWVPSADVSGPSLQSWGLAAGQLGLNPEVQAVWWGIADLHEVWAGANEGSYEAYRRYCRALLHLQNRENVDALHGWYQMQQFRTPVVIGAA